MRNLLKALALSLLLGATGCIRENVNECPQVNLVFRYDADGTENVIGKYIREAILYVFDRDGNPIMKQQLSDKELQSTKGIRLILPAKAYRLVCWGNASVHSRIVQGGRLEDFRMQHVYWGEDDRIHTFDPLYYASRGIEAKRGKGNTFEVEFHSAHIRMEIHIRGFAQRYGSGEVPVVKITGLDGQYDFDMNKVAPNGTTTCSPKNFWDEKNQAYTSLANVLRFKKESPTGISVYRQQENSEVFQLPMNELFRNFPFTDEGNPLFPLNREEAVVAITIDFAGNEIDASIVPPSWEEKPVAPGI